MCNGVVTPRAGVLPESRAKAGTGNSINFLKGLPLSLLRGFLPWPVPSSLRLFGFSLIVYAQAIPSLSLDLFRASYKSGQRGGVVRASLLCPML